MVYACLITKLTLSSPLKTITYVEIIYFFIKNALISFPFDLQLQFESLYIQ